MRVRECIHQVLPAPLVADSPSLSRALAQTYQEEVNYQKELAKKQKSVADLQTQLSLAKLDKSAAGQARARDLESQLQEAQEELDEYTLELTPQYQRVSHEVSVLSL